MILWPIATALESGLFDRILVSTDDPEIADVARSAGAEVPFMRPAELADDHCGTVEVVAHAMAWAANQGWNCNAACCLYATAVFATAEDMRAAQAIHTNGGWDYVLAAGRFDRAVQRAFARQEDGSIALLFPEHRLTRSQSLAPSYYDAGQFYWGSAQSWLEKRPILGHRSTLVELPQWRARDIDTAEDWAAAERIFTEWQNRTE